jgi:hypothetical protein
MEKKFNNLEDLPKRDSLKAPDGYFSSLASRIDERLEARKETKSVFLMYRRLSIAASVAGILCVGWLGYKVAFTPAKTAERLLAEIPVHDLQLYLSADDVEVEDLLAVATEDMLEPTQDRIDDVIESLDEGDINDLYNEFEIAKDDTL